MYLKHYYMDLKKIWHISKFGKRLYTIMFCFFELLVVFNVRYQPFNFFEFAFLIWWLWLKTMIVTSFSWFSSILVPNVTIITKNSRIKTHNLITALTNNLVVTKGRGTLSCWYMIRGTPISSVSAGAHQATTLLLWHLHMMSSHSHVYS